MKRPATGTLVAACPAFWAASAPVVSAADGGQPVPRRMTTGDVGGHPGAHTPPPVVIDSPPNQAPVVTITGPAGGSAFPAGATVSFTGAFTDEIGDTHSAQWSFGAITTAGAVTEPGGSVAGLWTFHVPGIYFVSLTVTDQAGNSGTATTVNGQDAMIVVFDRGDGFVDGKGRLDSPPGAFAADPLLTGRLDFTFDARYRKDQTVPTGTTQIAFSAGDLDFRSTSYDWFAVTGARALYRGTGTVNGAGDFAFLISALDGDDIGGGALDRLRIRITNRPTGAVVYDNQPGAPDTAIATTPISWGDVNVRLPNGGLGHIEASATRPAMEPSASGLPPGFSLTQNGPNPFRASTEILFSLPVRTHLKLAVFDVAGREVATLADGAWDAGTHSVRWAGRTGSGGEARRGAYFLRMAGESDGQRFTSVRKMIVLD